MAKLPTKEAEQISSFLMETADPVMRNDPLSVYKAKVSMLVHSEEQELNVRKQALDDFRTGLVDHWVRAQALEEIDETEASSIKRRVDASVEHLAHLRRQVTEQARIVEQLRRFQRRVGRLETVPGNLAEFVRKMDEAEAEGTG